MDNLILSKLCNISEQLACECCCVPSKELLDEACVEVFKKEEIALGDDNSASANLLSLFGYVFPSPIDLSGASRDIFIKDQINNYLESINSTGRLSSVTSSTTGLTYTAYELGGVDTGIFDATNNTTDSGDLTANGVTTTGEVINLPVAQYNENNCVDLPATIWESGTEDADLLEFIAVLGQDFEDYISNPLNQVACTP